jgi:hypothetical protein
MAFIGNTVQVQGFTPAVDYFSGNASTVTFTLSRPVLSTAQMIVSVANVVQNPGSAYTVSGSAITFTSAPPSGTNNIWVEYTSLITTYAAISQSPSVIGDITASGGYLATGNFNNSFIDGTIVDYVTGNGRITAGPADGITLYNGGTTGRTALLTAASNGNVGIGNTTPATTLSIGSGGGSGSYGGGVYLNRGASTYNFYEANDGTNSVIFGLDNNVSNAKIGTVSSTPIGLYVGNSARLYIDTSGNVFVGGTTQNTSTKPVYSSTTAKAWVLFSYNGSSTSINGSFNVSSVARNGAFNYTVNFSSALVDANYSYAFSGSNTNNGTGTNYTGFYKYGGSQTQSSFTFQGLNIYNGGANQSENVSDVSVIFFR